jgi:ABC-2 type transport system ATP-binding protein
MNAIEINDLTKRYGSLLNPRGVLALNAVSFDVRQGEIFGLLGPNGAGKTTLLKILLGITMKSGGRATVLGHHVPSVASRKNVGFLPEDLHFPRYMTGRSALMAFGRIMKVHNLRAAADKNLEITGMLPWAKMKIRRYSRGMTRRVGLALAFLNDPAVVFLDEPTDGLDPMGRRTIRDLLLYMKAQGKTIFLCSHILSEVETICDRVAILNNGSLVRIGRIDELTAGGLDYRIVLSKADDALDAAISPLVRNYRRDNQTISFTVSDEAEIDRVVDAIRSRGAGLRELAREKKSLEEVFLKTITDEVGANGAHRNN